jgi:hypothetical protein
VNGNQNALVPEIHKIFSLTIPCQIISYFLHYKFMWNNVPIAEIINVLFNVH